MSVFESDYLVKKHKTGSNYICSPPVEGTDIDTIVLAKPGYMNSLEELGFSYEPSEQEYESLGAFVSWRRGNENYIVTQEEDFYKKFVVATKIAKKLNLQKKQQRIGLFQIILYNNWD